MKVPQKYLERMADPTSDPLEAAQQLFDENDDLDHASNLERLCRMGWPDPNDNPEFTVKDASRSGNLFSVTCEVYFCEEYPGGGCENMRPTQQVRGTITYETNLLTGEFYSVDGKVIAEGNPDDY